MRLYAYQENTQRQPKAVLQQQCQKNGWDVPKYEKLSTISDMYIYNVAIMRPNSGRGKNKNVRGLTIFTVPELLAGSKTIEVCSKQRFCVKVRMIHPTFSLDSRMCFLAAFYAFNALKSTGSSKYCRCLGSFLLVPGAPFVSYCP